MASARHVIPFPSRPCQAFVAGLWSRSASSTSPMLSRSSSSTSVVPSQASSISWATGLRGEAQAEAEDVGIIVTPGAPCCLGIVAESSADAGDFVGCDADSGAGPAEEDLDRKRQRLPDWATRKATPAHWVASPCFSAPWSSTSMPRQERSCATPSAATVHRCRWPASSCPESLLDSLFRAFHPARSRSCCWSLRTSFSAWSALSASSSIVRK